MKLNARETAFVDAYMGEACGNATKAAQLAGYSEKSARQAGYKLLKKGDIQKAIDDKHRRHPLVASKEELHEFWSTTMRNPEVPWKDRLKASELHGKANGLFIDRQQHDLTITVDVTGTRERLASTLASLEARVTRALPERTE